MNEDMIEDMKVNCVIYDAQNFVSEYDIVRIKNGKRKSIDTACVVFNADGDLFDDNGLVMTAEDCAEKIGCLGFETVFNNGRYCLMMWKDECALVDD